MKYDQKAKWHKREMNPRIHLKGIPKEKNRNVGGEEIIKYLLE